MPKPMVLVRTTLPAEAQARHLADSLVGSGLAACVHHWAVQATYVWEGKTEAGPEVFVEARCLPGREAEVRQRMAEGHPYQVPLIESCRVEVASAYARWAGLGAAGGRVQRDQRT